jgi:hypothetical protein
MVIFCTEESHCWTCHYFCNAIKTKSLIWPFRQNKLQDHWILTADFYHKDPVKREINIAKFFLRNVLMRVILCRSLCACAESKRRHRNRNKTTPAPLTDESDIDSDATTLIPHINITVNSKGKQNGYKMWTIDKYPNPQTQPRKCGRSRQSSFLCDPERILSPAEGNNIFVSFPLIYSASCVIHSIY